MNVVVNFGEHLMMIASAYIFYIAVDYKNKTDMKAATSNINIKIHQLFSKLQILGIRLSIV